MSLLDSQSFLSDSQSLPSEWYPKLILLNGCEIDDKSLVSLLAKWFPKYIHRNNITDNFYDDITVGIFTHDGLYELRKYKTSTYPFKETYFLIHDKIVIDIATTGNIKMIIQEEVPDSLSIFANKIKTMNLTINKYIVITG